MYEVRETKQMMMTIVMTIEISINVLYTCFGVRSEKSFLNTSSTLSIISKRVHCFLNVKKAIINEIIPNELIHRIIDNQ